MAFKSSLGDDTSDPSSPPRGRQRAGSDNFHVIDKVVGKNKTNKKASFGSSSSSNDEKIILDNDHNEFGFNDFGISEASPESMKHSDHAR